MLGQQKEASLIRACYIVQGPNHFGSTSFIYWLPMPWLLTSPGHQHPRYWLHGIGKIVSYMRTTYPKLMRKIAAINGFSHNRKMFMDGFYSVSARAAYLKQIYIENRFLRFDRYILSEVNVSIKISKRKYFDIVVTSWLSSRENQYLANPNILTTAQETPNLGILGHNGDIIAHESKLRHYTLCSLSTS